MSQIHYSFFEDQNGPVLPQQGNSSHVPLNNDTFFSQQMAFQQREMPQHERGEPERSLQFQQSPHTKQPSIQNDQDFRSEAHESDKSSTRNTRLILLQAMLEDIQKNVAKALDLVKEELVTPSVFSISEISQAQTVTKKEVEISQGVSFSLPSQNSHQQPQGQQYHQGQPSYESSESYGQTKILEGVFDGQHMCGSDGKQYNIPPNYASKSKLVEGDILKLTMSQQGSFMFKQIGPIERLRIAGTLGQDPLTRDYFVYVGDHKWRILTASVTYYKGIPGDEIVILIPKGTPSKWAAVENIIKRNS